MPAMLVSIGSVRSTTLLNLSCTAPWLQPIPGCATMPSPRDNRKKCFAFIIVGLLVCVDLELIRFFNGRSVQRSHTPNRGATRSLLKVHCACAERAWLARLGTILNQQHMRAVRRAPYSL